MTLKAPVKEPLLKKIWFEEREGYGPIHWKETPNGFKIWGSLGAMQGAKIAFIGPKIND